MSKFDELEWVFVDGSTAFEPPPAAGKRNLPRSVDPSMFHVIAWDVAYERGRWATVQEEEVVEVVEEVEKVEEVEEEKGEEEDLSENAWLTEMQDAYDNVYGFGKDDLREEEVVKEEEKEKEEKEKEEKEEEALEGIADELVKEAIGSAIQEVEVAKKTTKVKKVKKVSMQEDRTRPKTPTKSSKPRAGLTSPFLEKRKKSMMVKAKLANVIKAQAVKEPQLMFSRSFPDTTFWKKFRKPVFHSYGRGNVKPTFGGSVWGGYMLSFNIGPQTLPNYPHSKQVVRSAEFKYNAVAVDPSIPGASILQKRDVVSIPFNPLFNPMIIDDNDIAVSKGKTDTSITRSAEKERTAKKIFGTEARPPPSPNKAKPAKEAAKKAKKKKKKGDMKEKVKTLIEVEELTNMKRRDISELKSFKKVQPIAAEVTRAIVTLIIGPNAVTKTWEDTRSYLDGSFLKAVKSISLDDVPLKKAKELRKLLKRSSKESMRKISIILGVFFEVLKNVYEAKTGEKLVETVAGVEEGVRTRGDGEALTVVVEEGGADEKAAELREEDPLVSEIIQVYRCNPRLMKKLPPKYFLSIPIAGVKVEHGVTAKELMVR